MGKMPMRRLTGWKPVRHSLDSFVWPAIHRGGFGDLIGGDRFARTICVAVAVMLRLALVHEFLRLLNDRGNSRQHCRTDCAPRRWLRLGLLRRASDFDHHALRLGSGGLI